MKKIIVFLAIAACATLMTACGGSVGMDPQTQETLAKLNSSYDLDGQEVELTGYLGVPHAAFIIGDAVRVGLHSIAGQKGTQNRIADAKVNFGKAPNSYYAPENYTGSSIEIYDSEGNKHGYLTSVKVKGTVNYTRKEWKSQLIEMPPSDVLVGLDKLKAQRVEKLKKDAEERQKATGDPNDYTFELTITEISPAK